MYNCTNLPQFCIRSAYLWFFMFVRTITYSIMKKPSKKDLYSYSYMNTWTFTCLIILLTEYRALSFPGLGPQLPTDNYCYTVDPATGSTYWTRSNTRKYIDFCVCIVCLRDLRVVHIWLWKVWMLNSLGMNVVTANFTQTSFTIIPSSRNGNVKLCAVDNGLLYIIGM